MCGMSTLAARLADTEALVLIRERTQIRMQLLHACPGPGRPAGAASIRNSTDTCTRLGIAPIKGVERRDKPPLRRENFW